MNKEFYYNIFESYQIDNNKRLTNVAGLLRTSSVFNSIEEKLNFLQNILWKQF